MDELTKPPPTVTDRCGTVAGYALHIRRWEQTCAQCRRAQAEYRAAYRSDSATALRQEQLRACRTRALRRLVRLYPEEYDALLREEIGRKSGTA